MSARRFPTLIVTSATGVDDWSGMIPIEGFDLQTICDDDLIPGTKPSALLREAVADFLHDAKDMAQGALAFDGIVRSGPYLSVLPRLNGSEYEFVMAWKGNGGTAYVASTRLMLHLKQGDSQYAAYDSLGRIIALGNSVDSMGLPY